MSSDNNPIILSCVNLKGGVGKTAVAVNFAAYCGLKSLKTLLIDLDPQTNATFSCISIKKWEDHAAAKGTVANLLGVRQHTNAEGRTKTAAEVTIHNVFKNVDLIPSHLDLFTIDLDLSAQAARETLLRRAIKDIVGHYDIVVCDCPPNLATLKAEYAVLSQSVHGSAINFRMTDTISSVLLWNTDRVKLGMWSTREKRVFEALSLLLICLHSRALQGTRMPALRAMLYFTIRPGRRVAIQQALHVSIPSPQ